MREPTCEPTAMKRAADVKTFQTTTRHTRADEAFKRMLLRAFFQEKQKLRQLSISPSIYPSSNLPFKLLSIYVRQS